jgi:hypothetical protein
MINIGEAIMSLRPNSEWVLVNDEVENIEFVKGDGAPLTQEEVKAELSRLETESVEKEKKALASRKAAIAHAKSLGFTDSMISEMFPALKN